MAWCGTTNWIVANFPQLDFLLFLQHNESGIYYEREKKYTSSSHRRHNQLHRYDFISEITFSESYMNSRGTSSCFVSYLPGMILPRFIHPLFGDRHINHIQVQSRGNHYYMLVVQKFQVNSFNLNASRTRLKHPHEGLSIFSWKATHGNSNLVHALWPPERTLCFGCPGKISACKNFTRLNLLLSRIRGRRRKEGWMDVKNDSQRMLTRFQQFSCSSSCQYHVSLTDLTSKLTQSPSSCFH